MPLAQHEKVFIGYGVAIVAGAFAFWGVRIYADKNRGKILESRARMNNALLEDYVIDDKFWYTKQYKEQQERLASKTQAPKNN